MIIIPMLGLVCQPLDQDYLIDESSGSCLADFAPLALAQGDWVHEDEGPQEHLLPQEVGLAGASPSWRPALTIC